jgi:asparagine synthase (glutamine-hydrolysing)
MCRIAGIFDPSNSQLKEDILKMRDAMHKGGPDDAGIYIDGHLALGHRRLSILDLSVAGHQPMLSDDHNIVLCFNGEIYNFQEIRIDLELLGFEFKTKTDSEVILKAYQKWGKDCFEKFNGMFALAIYDKINKEIILARDHAGIKPLYYFLEDGKLYFASEIRAFKTLNSFEENPDWPIYFLAFGHLPEPITTLNKVKSLYKGTCLTYNIENQKVSEFQIYKFSYSKEIDSVDIALSKVRETLSQAVKRHLISDAPIGLFLSGGIDSSLLTLLAEPILKERLQTLSIVFDEEKFSEKKYQEIIIKKTGANHRTFTVTKEQFLDALPDVMEATDQPSTDGINSYFICKYAKETGLTAVLSGLGADELFGGYNSFANAAKIELIKKWVPSIGFKTAQFFKKDKYQKAAFLKIPSPVGEYLFNRGLLCPKEISKVLSIDERKIWKLLSELNKYYDNRIGFQNDFKNQNISKASKFQNLHSFNKASFLETNFYMQNQLLRDSDYMSMWHSIEIRVPFLDKDLMQLAYSINCQIKQNTNQKKFLLVEAFKDILPQEIWDRPKMGFAFPFQQWLQGMDKLVTKNENQLHSKSNKINRFAVKNSYALNQFKKGNYTWSRYWVTILTQNF